MNAQELHDRLTAPHVNAETAAETAIMVYHAAKFAQEEWQAVADAAKAMLQEIMLETERTSITTPAGKAAITAPSVSVSYDAKALSALCASSPDVARMLEPHRKTTERAGTLRITAAK
jgi:multidrug efflux pump subunit AcrA (membrane-fusion protein)